MVLPLVVAAALALQQLLRGLFGVVQIGANYDLFSAQPLGGRAKRPGDDLFSAQPLGGRDLGRNPVRTTPFLLPGALAASSSEEQDGDALRVSSPAARETTQQKKASAPRAAAFTKNGDATKTTLPKRKTITFTTLTNEDGTPKFPHEMTQQELLHGKTIIWDLAKMGEHADHRRRLGAIDEEGPTLVPSYVQAVEGAFPEQQSAERRYVVRINMFFGVGRKLVGTTGCL